MALNAYGHAYGVRPNDFTAAEYAAIAGRFRIFTVEKDHARAVYGNESAPPPFQTNSLAASVGTAQRIKAHNASVKVLMYWNAALHYNFYECESEVDVGWTMPNPNPKKSVRYWNYSVPAFRTWWVRCAVDAVRGSGGALDGLFLDATPKVDNEQDEGARFAPWALWSHLEQWGKMVDSVRAALGLGAIIIDNGFYLTPAGGELAGNPAWAHTGVSYTESMKAVGSTESAEQGAAYLEWLAAAASAHPNRTLIGHGGLNATATGATTDPAFTFGLAKYMLVTSSTRHGWFLANAGSYSIDGGLLAQPAAAYRGEGLGCGEPLAPLARVGTAGQYRFRRNFERGTVDVDLQEVTATIACGAATLTAEPEVRTGWNPL
jgi:hypothetical protein